MRFYADLHVHSKYSRACSRDCDLEHLAWWAQRKGVTLVGTGDFTHPAWHEHLRETLVPAEPGLFKLTDDLERSITERVPASCRGPVRFMLSVEISTIYKRADRTRKVHHLIYMPDLDAVAEFNRRLGRIGNITSDGRPILGLDSRDLLEIALESSDDAYLIPAHVWTPWFAVLGSKSGFDAISDCYADLADHIFAAETGLSSDPEMNWRVSSLDRYTLVSNSDAHSPPALAREATVFDCELDYASVRRALETREGFGGTIEFFPEEGKYHADGHRNCNVRMDPPETRRLGGRCPVCGKQLTVGVLHRVLELADRPEGAKPEGAVPGRGLIPLPELVGEVLGVGAKSKAVGRLIDGLVAKLGPELEILERVPLDDLGSVAPPLLVEALDRVRRGDVVREAGYDGEYGVIRAFDPDDLRHRRAATATLFEPMPAARPAAAGRGGAAVGGGSTVGGDQSTLGDRIQAPSGETLPHGRVGAEAVSTGGGPDPGGGGLDPDQEAAAELVDGPLLIVAGPGTGKTRTLTHRIARLIETHGVEPERCLAITFTRRAAEELDERLRALLPEAEGRVEVATFHALGLRILREQHAAAGLPERFRIADDVERLAIVRELAGGLTTESAARRLLGELSALKRGRAAAVSSGVAPAPAQPAATPELAATLAHLDDAMRGRGLIDLDDLLALPVRLLAADHAMAAAYAERWRYVSVDEYQDVDELQYRLLRLLVPPDGNLCAIGDPDQAIYSFRGADVGFFLRFAADYPTARTIRLTRNYRSSRTIVEGALQAIAPAALVRDRSLSAVRRGPAPLITVHQAASERAEAEFVTRTIDKLLGGASFHSLDTGRADGAGDAFAELSFGDIAVLYRTGAQADPLAEALARAGLPFQKRTHERLLDHPGVQAVVDVLRAWALPGWNAVDGPTAPGSGSGAGSGSGVGAGGDLGRDLGRDFSGGGVTAPPGAARLPGLPEATAGPLVPSLVRQAAKAALDTAPRLEELDEPAARGAVEAAIDLLGPLAERCGDDLDRFLAELALGAQVDALDPRADCVSLLTMHAAKGLEFPVVFVTGCEDGLLPLRFGAAAGRAGAATAETAGSGASGTDGTQGAGDSRSGGDGGAGHNPGAHNPGAHNPGAHNPGAHNPGAHNPGAHNPGAHNLGANGPGQQEARRLAGEPAVTGTEGEPGGPGEDEDAEERRLFFVGMTRARSHLYLTHARQRVRHGAARESAPSPFLREISETLIAHEQGKARRAAPAGDQLSLL